MNNPIASAIKLISDEKGIPQEEVVTALEAALAAAYRKDFGEKNQNIKVEFDIKTGVIHVFDVKTVVEDIEEDELAEIVDEEGAPTVSGEVTDGEDEKKRFNPKTEIMISQARNDHPDSELGQEIKTELRAPDLNEFGRMAAQTAKQVLIQKDREAERNILFSHFKDKEDAIMIGIVQRREEHRVLVDLGKVTAILPNSEQIPRERYMPNDRVKVYVVSVNAAARGPEIIVSRAHPNMVKKIFENEIPEVASGSIEVKGVSRDAGQRSKVAVFSHQENIDPIGSCIGQRGSRIQTIISELGGEKIDVIQYDEDPEKFIIHALSPAKIESITLQEQSATAYVTVAQDQLSLAIGKQGQNVRLASQLTGWNIEVQSKEVREEDDFDSQQAEESEKSVEEYEQEIPTEE